MFLASFAAGPWQANCYVIAPKAGGDCAIVDPGMGAVGGVLGIVEQYGLRPSAVLLTHGHVDHVASAAAVADQFGVPCWIHPDDRVLLTQPALGLGAGAADMLRDLLPEPLVEPRDLRFVSPGTDVVAGSITFRTVHAPGHTPGSVIYLTRYAGDEAITQIGFTGDVLFFGSIGRTDLPGGDHATLLTSLREAVLTLPDTTAVLSGHGVQTTIGRERAENPFLQPDYLAARA